MILVSELPEGYVPTQGGYFPEVVKIFEPEWSTYHGEVEVHEVELRGPPGMGKMLAWEAEQFVRANGGTMLSLIVEHDSAAIIDKYKLTISAHASPLPWGLIIAFGLFTLFVFITSKTKTINWTAVKDDAKQAVVESVSVVTEPTIAAIANTLESATNKLKDVLSPILPIAVGAAGLALAIIVGLIILTRR